MFIRPELRKGDFDLRVTAPRSLVEKLDLIAIALGISRQDVALFAIDAFVEELSHVSKVLAPVLANQRRRNGNKTEANR